MNASVAPPLITRLARSPGAQWVDTRSLDAFRALAGDAALLIWSDPVRFPECLDVAVVLPELRAHVCADGGGDRFRIGVVTADAEDSLARVFGALRRPSLVFLRDGVYVTTVAGMLDWDDFVRAVQSALQAPPTRVPSIGIPLVGQAASGCH